MCLDSLGWDFPSNNELVQICICLLAQGVSVDNTDLTNLPAAYIIVLFAIAEPPRIPKQIKCDKLQGSSRW